MADPWMKFYASDWLAGTRGLSLQETGLYITLIAMMYEKGAPIDMPDARLSRLCGSTPAAFKKALEGLLDAGKLERSEKGIWNKRVAKEIQKREKKSSSSRESANERWEKTKQKQRSLDANASEAQCERDASRSQIPDTRSNAREATNKFEPIMEDFRRAWDAYPGGQGKGGGSPTGLAAFRRCVDRGHCAEAIIAAAKHYAATEPDFPKAFHNWLDSEGWEAWVPSKPAGPNWAGEVELFKRFGDWRMDGPPPDQPGCLAPTDILKQAGYPQLRALEGGRS